MTHDLERMIPQLIRTLDPMSIYRLEQSLAIRARVDYICIYTYIRSRLCGLDLPRIVDLRRVIKMSAIFINKIIREWDNTISLEIHML